MHTRFYEFGAFRIDKLNHVLLRDGEAQPLKPKVFDTLLLLVENRDRVIDKDELLGRLWPDTVVEESNLTQNVYLLRKALGEEPHGETFIQTMPKRGYRFVAAVTEVGLDSISESAGTKSKESVGDNRHDLASDTAAILKKSAAAGHVEPSRTAPAIRWQPIALIAVMAAAIVLSISIGRLLLNKPSNVSPPSADIKSLAVFPFKPLGSDVRDEGLGFGLADTLITHLSNIRSLVIRPTSSVRRFGSPDQDPIAAGRELKVDAVLDATMQRSGDRIRINLRLIRVSDGVALWNGKVDEHVNDTFAVQDRVAEQVAQALVPHLTGEEQQLLVKRYTENAEAYRLNTLGRYHLDRTTVGDWKKAIEYFNAAIEKDQNYSLAYTGLANAYLSLVADSLLAKEEAIPKAKQAATAALRLDDGLAEAHVSAGRIKTYYDWDWVGAEQEFKRAIELNPNSGDAHREYAAYLTNTGRTEPAIAEAIQARDLDPLTLVTNFQLAWTFISAHRYDEAIHHSQEVLPLFPTAHFWIGMAYLGKRMYPQAIAEFEKNVNSSKNHDPLTRAHLAYAYAMSGREDEARKILPELESLYHNRQASPYHIAIVSAGLGDKDRAFAWLDECYRQRSRPLVSGLKVNPVWDNLRSDPRFGKLLQRMGLPS
ncbi:MAG TPA: winged helix-turn-helix domain-containing protein [Pyrinomonadaceae bacterium]|jgi:DNA-binding winged helix-turn-helix (wHTH) protein/TolB-like protein/Flp pilus assembly protein TadD|nr:winged helix-turn-helix domain-containing protein [Pyrinomonadaceae bacterium]